MSSLRPLFPFQWNCAAERWPRLTTIRYAALYLQLWDPSISNACDVCAPVAVRYTEHARKGCSGEVGILRQVNRPSDTTSVIVATSDGAGKFVDSQSESLRSSSSLA